ncbi:hypothetical protein COM13_04925 [Bacillus pseudomycoides]|uniref:DUF4064 domain-containing protein n=1 Tax=Bacillus pseudomycoides TaxID=64104 RepID=UPI000BED31B8|nr:DUF4064 domain-containing protein [Bacillus pseudomycoides]PDY01215.1 hypothetical protein COO07_05120 [Bacillus pseudomycoides]PEK76655.1 hypothetical protein CN597_21310 [Bacillus pseudomycoides]PEN10569.1 hypothetical protein CN640_06100 [Bacillus pseudomycoides]PGB91682.1 hypothetical protein COM13_04925 [Bacillus pseudomycoides]PHE55128.1 hypothetical protein COF52_16925 [Bacillus pseudomycoides]
MKRTPEFILGLIGGIFGVIGSFIILMIAITAMDGYIDYKLLTYYSILLIIQIGLLVLACSVNKVNNIAYGLCMILLPLVTLVMSLFLLLIPVILRIISGGFAFRFLKQESH